MESWEVGQAFRKDRKVRSGQAFKTDKQQLVSKHTLLLSILAFKLNFHFFLNICPKSVCVGGSTRAYASGRSCISGVIHFKCNAWSRCDQQPTQSPNLELYKNCIKLIHIWYERSANNTIIKKVNSCLRFMYVKANYLSSESRSMALIPCHFDYSCSYL